MFVLDTNVLSELMRPEPDRGVVEWIDEQPAQSLYTTSITKAEILHGVLLLPGGRRKDRIEAAAEAMFSEDFEGRLLSFDGRAAGAYARIAVSRRRAGRPISSFDAQIAAIARSSGATLATRNTGDFSDCGVEVLNPWSS